MKKSNSSRSIPLRIAFTVSVIALGIFVSSSALEKTIGSYKRKQIMHHFPLHDSTEFLQFHLAEENEVVRDFIRLSTPLIKALQIEFLKLDYSWPLHAFFFSTKEQYLQFLNTIELNTPILPTAGVYLPAYRSFFTYADAGLSTFTHEILHPLLDATYGQMPHWADEGLPAYGEVFNIWGDEDDIILDLGYPHPLRLHNIRSRLKTLSLKDVLCCTESTSEKRIVATFLKSHNLLDKYLIQMKKEDKKGFNSLLEATFQQNLQELEPLWRNHLDSLYEQTPHWVRHKKYYSLLY